MRKRREDRRERQREREEESEYDAIDDAQYEERNIPPDPELDEPVYEDEVEPEFNEYEDVNDPSNPNGAMEDLGYIDE